MNIAIIGAGNVGQALAHALTQRGEAVYLGVPDPDKYRTAVAALGAQAQLGTVAAAIEGMHLGIPSIAFSQARNYRRGEPVPWETGKVWGPRVLKALLKSGWPKNCVSSF